MFRKKEDEEVIAYVKKLDRAFEEAHRKKDARIAIKHLCGPNDDLGAAIKKDIIAENTLPTYYLPSALAVRVYTITDVRVIMGIKTYIVERELSWINIPGFKNLTGSTSGGRIDSFRISVHGPHMLAIEGMNLRIQK